MKKQFLISVILLFLALTVSATDFKYTPTIQSDSVDNNDIKVLAKYWGLSQQEYRRYMKIIQGPLGRWNTNIDPILALGIYAENQTEKRRYAELYAKQEYELTLLTQEFQREYRSAFNRLYPNSQVIENKYLQDYYKHQSKKTQNYSPVNDLNYFQPGDRILYFPKIDCQSCEDKIKKIYSILEKHPTIIFDIYLVGAKKDNEVRIWAKEKQIKIDWVKLSRVTLNIDNGLWNRLNAEKLEGNYLYLSRGDSIFKIEPNQIGL